MALSKETEKIIAKNLSEKTEKIAGNLRGKNALEEGVVSSYAFLFGFVGPILAIFQIAAIIISGTSAGVSLIYWAGYLAVASMWFGYGIFIKNKRLIGVYGSWILTEIIVINLVLFY